MSKIAPPSPPMIPARFHGGSQVPKAIVMHGTVSPCKPGNARAVAKWWHGPTSPKTSANYVADPAESIQCVPDHTVAYHCGYNTGSIGYEMSDPETGPPSRWHDDAHRAMLKIVVADIARLCLAYDIDPHRPTIAALKAKGPHGIYGHNDSRLAFGNTTHSDPIGFPWPDFLAQVRAEIARLSDPAPKPAPKPTAGPKLEKSIAAAQSASVKGRRKTIRDKAVALLKSLRRPGVKS